MIRDTSAQDRPLPARPWHRRRAFMAGSVLAAVALLLAFAAPRLQQLLAADNSVSAARLVVAPVERGSFVRDIAAEGQVVAAVSATLYAAAPGAKRTAAASHSSTAAKAA